jgi:hypothetical protein
MEALSNVTRADGVTRIGALVPLTRPGWVQAGRHLLAGLELAVADVNAAGGPPLELLVRDTAADPERAAAAVDELARLGVAAVAGEYHSVAARGAAARAHALDLPFLCSSAVLDALMDEPSDRVARLAPAQSHGWRIYADFLRAEGHRRIAVAAQPSRYWASGTRILREHLDSVLELDPADVADELAKSDATALLLLVGDDELAQAIVASVRRDPRLTHVLIGAPAGQPEFSRHAAIPFLRYLPERLTPLGERVRAALHAKLNTEPSFVAFEGYDTILVLAGRPQSWASVNVEGTRGPITFSRVPGISVWQWTWPPVQIAERDPRQLDHFRVRRTE